GLTVYVDDSPSAVLYTPSGTWISPAIQSQNGWGDIGDANGNMLSVNYTGEIFTDTLGATALTITPGSTSISYKYTGPDGNFYYYTVNYTQQTVRTNF